MPASPSRPVDTPAPVILNFAAAVRAEMDRKRFNVSTLAEACEMDRPYLSRLLNGHVGHCSLLTADRIAQALGVPLADLLRPPAAS